MWLAYIMKACFVVFITLFARVHSMSLNVCVVNCKTFLNSSFLCLYLNDLSILFTVINVNDVLFQTVQSSFVTLTLLLYISENRHIRFYAINGHLRTNNVVSASTAHNLVDCVDEIIIVAFI